MRSTLSQQMYKYPLKAQRWAFMKKCSDSVQMFNEDGHLVNIRESLGHKLVKEFHDVTGSPQVVGYSQRVLPFRIKKYMKWRGRGAGIGQHRRFQNYKKKCGYKKNTYHNYNPEVGFKLSDFKDLSLSYYHKYK